MRILFLTNFYPPYELGGQGRSCQQVVEGLKQRGHSALVLTSRHGIDNQPPEDDEVCRCLYLQMELTPLRHGLIFFTRRRQREKHNLHILQRLLAQFQPDLVFVWGMWNLSHSLPALAEAQCPGRVVYRFAEYWPTLPSQHELYWRAPGRNRVSRLVKEPLGRLALALLARDGQRPALRFEHVICVSRATRDVLVEAGIPVAHARTIHTGLDVEEYPNGDGLHSDDEHQELRLLYAGRLSADKGVETAIEAMEYLVRDQGIRQVTLSLAGSGSADYMSHLRQLVAHAGLESFITFLGWIPHEKMPRLMLHFDALLVPSKWPEPFARVVLEGMVSGLVVVATPTGGTSEIIRDEENGLLFEPGNSQELAQKITCLAADLQLRQQLRNAGRKTVSEQFTLTKMLDLYENFLLEVAANHGRTRSNSVER